MSGEEQAKVERMRKVLLEVKEERRAHATTKRQQ